MGRGLSENPAMMLAMEPTDLSTLSLPHDGAAWILAADPVAVVDRQRAPVNLSWWNESLSERALPGGPVTGTDGSGMVVETGRADITRAQLFGYADAATTDPHAALRLLWPAMAWGSGTAPRNKHKLMNGIRHDPGGAGRGLMAAGQLSRTDPQAAYELLFPNGRPLIDSLGPSFLTKYLYFAGGGSQHHRCLILDQRVAHALAVIGWNSLAGTSNWPAATYLRYLTLLERWRSELSGSSGRHLRLDLFEYWLFAVAPRVTDPSGDVEAAATKD